MLAFCLSFPQKALDFPSRCTDGSRVQMYEIGDPLDTPVTCTKRKIVFLPLFSLR